jgi:16S rRNA (cytosine967-C5)-methyltransferase
MTPSARLQAAIDILDALKATAQPADRLLKDWFRARRFAGSKDRAAITERVFAVLRRSRVFGHRMDGDDGRALVLGSLAGEGLALADIEALFSGTGYGPGPLSDSERAHLSAQPASVLPLNVEGDFPQFLESELTKAFGAGLLDEMKALQQRAPVDLRVNTMKGKREALLSLLKAEGFAVEPTPHSPVGLRIPPGEGTAALSRSAAFLAGLFEFQDEAAQICVLLCDPKPGSRILDMAAGAGGKSLALSALMKGEGEIIACDVRPAPLQELIARADRAGDAIIRTQIITNAPPEGPFDLVLVDAPCSGSGTWRRQPELKLRFTPQRLGELIRLQDELLDLAAARTVPGGRLVYATCSILPSENEARVEAFLARYPEFTLIPAASVWKGQPVPGLGRMFRGSPHTTGTDGFFTALLSRRPANG